MSTDTPKIQYQKEVEVRVHSFGETRCMNPQNPKTKKKENHVNNGIPEMSSTAPGGA